MREAAQAGADPIHIDVMDGHFVPNISMGIPIVASLRRRSQESVAAAMERIRGAVERRILTTKDAKSTKFKRAEI